MKSKNFFVYGLIIISVFSSLTPFIIVAPFGFQIKRINVKSNAIDRSWSIALDGYGLDMAIDSNNCIYIAGYDYIAKYNNSGAQLWNKELDGMFDEPMIKIDSTNNLYLGGYYTNQTLSRNWTIFKFNSFGNLLWQKVFGQVNTKYINDFAIDSEEYVYIYGTFLSYNLFLMKYNKSGSQLWFYEFEDIGLYDFGSNILIDSSFNIIISGHSTIDVNFSSIEWLRSYNMSKDLQWYIIQECESFPFFGLDSSNNIISIVQSNCSGLDLIKYDNFGNTIWNYKLESRFLNLLAVYLPTPMKYLFKLTLDTSDNTYIGWDIEIPNDMYTTDILLIKVNSSGSFEWFLTWGGPNNNYLSKIRTDSENNIYLLAGNILVKNPISNGKSLFRTNLWDFYFILFGIFCIISLISLYFIIRSKIRSRPIK